MRFKEIEFKYALPFTSSIPKELLRGLKDSAFVSGFDYYYAHDNGSIVRFRDGTGDFKEITVKANHHAKSKRTTVRDEINLPLKTGLQLYPGVRKFFELLGFKQTLQIFKKARIYYYDDYVISQYTVKVINKSTFKHQEGEYFEIEIKEGAYETEKESVRRLKELESQYGSLGISPTKRLNRSLYEIYNT